MPTHPYTVTARATVTVTDHGALVRQVDELVALTDEFTPIEDGTYWDGWEDREGTGYLFQGDAVWLDDDPEAMLTLALSLAHLWVPGVELDLDADVRRRLVPGDPATERFTAELTVAAAEITEPDAVPVWLAPKPVRGVRVQSLVAVRLLDSLAGATVKVTSVVARRDDAPVHAPGEQVVVRDGGESYETDERGFLVTPPPDEPTSTDGRRPLRFDGTTARHFVHFAHPIPITRGFRRAWVALNAPGWTGNDLFDALRPTGLIDRSGTIPRLVDGVTRVDIEPDGTCSRIDLDPRSLRPPVRRHRR